MNAAKVTNVLFRHGQRTIQDFEQFIMTTDRRIFIDDPTIERILIHNNEHLLQVVYKNGRHLWYNYNEWIGAVLKTGR